MADNAVEDPFETLFPIVVAETGSAYIAARDALLEQRQPAQRGQLLARLTETAADSSDWQQQLAAETLIGWMTNEADYRTCLEYVRGNLPGRRPLPGFTPQHRARAIAGLGTEITPRVLEMLRKTHEATNDGELGALFGALLHLKDARSQQPMIELLEPARAEPVRSYAIGVLSALGDPTSADRVIAVAQSVREPEALRLRAIRALAGFSDPTSSDYLTRLVTDTTAPLERQRAAAEALQARGDPSTRGPIASALAAAQDHLLRMSLIQALGEIGTAEDIQVLETVAADGDQELRDEVADAIEDITDREASSEEE